MLLSTLPCVSGPLPPEREWPWSYAWGPPRDGKLAPMMRSRGATRHTDWRHQASWPTLAVYGAHHA
eukprot:315959-Lingulodinium_polyedra.AAC.1